MTPLTPSQRGGDAVVESQVRLPAQEARSLVGVGVGANGISGTRGRFGDRHGCPEHPLEGRHQFTNRDAFAGADIDDDARGVNGVEDFVEALDRAYMSLRQIPDVDVVAKASAIAGRVVRSGDGELILQPRCRQDQLTEDV